MTDHNEYYTVNKVSQLTDVTIKTLHYYQKIGLLFPTKVGANNYRYYSVDDIKRLQEILVYRTMNFSLNEIHEILNNQNNESRLFRLEKQLEIVKSQMNNLQEVITTIEQSIIAERENLYMAEKDMFKGVKKDDDVYKSMQSLTILFSKFVSSIFFVLGFVAIYIYGKAYLNNDQLWAGEQANTINLGFVFFGLILIGTSGYTLFFTKIRKQLEIANKSKKS
ncbi:MAG: MerR family transcriptional regulator [Mobilitalea sp.]